MPNEELSLAIVAAFSDATGLIVTGVETFAAVPDASDAAALAGVLVGDLPRL